MRSTVPKRSPAARDERAPKISVGDYELGPRYPDQDLADPHLADYYVFQNQLSLSFDPEPTALKSRFMFFSGIKTFAASVIEDLDNKAFQTYSKLPFANHDSKPRVPIPRWFDIEFGTPFETHEEHFERLGEGVGQLYIAVRNWSIEHELNHPWCRSHAFDILRYWNKNKRSHRTLELTDAPIPFTSNCRLPSSFTFEMKIGSPTEIVRSEERSTQIKRFTAWLDGVLDDCERDAEKLGFIKSPVKFEGTHHFDWLAYYQCAPSKPSYRDIGLKFNVSKKGAQDGIESAAEICGLTLRSPAKGGRPRK